MKYDNFSQYFEWESFDYPLTTTNLAVKNNFYRIPTDSVVTIWRDDEYKLRGRIEGEINDKDAFEYIDPNRTLKDGHIIKGETILAADHTGTVNYEISNCYINNTSFQFSRNNGKIVFQFNASLNFNRFSEIYTEKEPSRVSDWYLTGKINIVFPRGTTRSKEETHSKIREIDKSDSTGVILNKTHGSSRDFFLIKTGNIKCIVQLAPKHFLPKWGNGIAIEFRKDFEIPDEETREAIAELVGFILGTQLLKIGTSEYDEEDRLIRKHANDPWGDNVIAKCDTSALSPIKFSKMKDWEKVENVINQILPNYIKLRKTLSLSDVLWKYWIARDLAIGTNLPILSSALESLAEQYLSHNNIQKKFTKDEKKEYKKLIEQEVTSLEIKLKDFTLKDNVLNKLRNPFQLSIGDKLRIFFKSLSFNIDNKSIETQALKSRNIMTHSTFGVSEESIPDAIRLTRGYETLFHRTLLKILSYNGTYIDYYSYGHVERELSENIKDV